MKFTDNEIKAIRRAMLKRGVLMPSLVSEQNQKAAPFVHEILDNSPEVCIELIMIGGSLRSPSYSVCAALIRNSYKAAWVVLVHNGETGEIKKSFGKHGDMTLRTLNKLLDKVTYGRT